MKILITGSSGYVGYVLSRFFSEKGVSVVGLDVVSNPVWKGNGHFVFQNCDVRDKKRMGEIFSQEKPTHVIHLAYLMNPIHDQKKNYEIDVLGSENVLGIANATKSVKQLVLFSSASAYGAWPDNKPWITEEQPLRPRDYRYGIHKKLVEEHYNRYAKRKNLKTVILRMCTAIGPSYHKKGGVVSLLANAPIFFKLNGRYCEIQFLHEEDLTALMNLIVDDTKIEGTFNLAPDSFSTTKELATSKIFVPLRLDFMRIVIALLWKLHLSSVMPAAMTLSTHGIVVSPEKLMKRYGYTFKYSTLEGFRDTVRKRRELGTL